MADDVTWHDSSSPAYVPETRTAAQRSVVSLQQPACCTTRMLLTRVSRRSPDDRGQFITVNVHLRDLLVTTCENGWTDRDVVWVVDSCWAKEPCIRLGPDPSHWEGNILGHIRTCSVVDTLEVAYKRVARGDASCLPPSVWPLSLCLPRIGGYLALAVKLRGGLPVQRRSPPQY